MSNNKILIVDDEIIIAREIEYRLQQLGYAIVGAASSGEEALELVALHQPDLVLMDIVLKGAMDGIEAAAEIVRQWNIPVIFVTAYTDEETLQRAKITEPYAYIVKPFSERELRANIEMALYKHRVESKLRAMERWFATSMQRIAEGVIATKDLEGTVCFINTIAELLTGFRYEEAIGKKTEEIVSLISKNNRQRIEDPIRRTLNEGIVSELESDIILVNKYGDEIPIGYTCACLRDNGGALGVVLVLRDLSERAHTEEKLRMIEDQLHQAKKMYALGQLAGGVAHDFNNLLTVIFGNSELLLQRMPKDDPNYGLVNEIYQTGKRAALVTQRLLIFSRKAVIEPKLLNINDIVSDMKPILQRLIGEHIQLNTLLGRDLKYIKIDPGQIEQVLINLTANARDAMPNGGAIVIETSTVELDERYCRLHPQAQAGRYVLLKVRDTGCGMDQETLSHLFEPFFTTKNRGKGTGLGLATVFGIIEQHKGYIEVHSQPNEGSEFLLYFPVSGEAPPPHPPTEPLHSDLRGTETILLVEDDDNIREITRKILQLYGYTLHTARTGKEALQILDRISEPIDMLISDLILPDMNGAEMAREIQKRESTIKVLFISGYTDHAIDQENSRFGRASFLQKPFTIRELAQKVRELFVQV